MAKREKKEKKKRAKLEGARPAMTSDLDAVRSELAALTERVAVLEGHAVAAARRPAVRKPAEVADRATKRTPANSAAPIAKTTSAAKPAPGKTAAGGRSGTAASKVPAARAAARRSAASKRPG